MQKKNALPGNVIKLRQYRTEKMRNKGKYSTVSFGK